MGGGELPGLTGQQLNNIQPLKEPNMDKQFPTEEEMHEMKAPWPETPEELVAFITTITDRPHDYGTCVSAMSLAAEAAFNYVASVLAVTGFQASCADLDFLRRTRRIKGPFALIEGEDMMYPQYDIFNKTIQTINNWRPWAAKEAQKRIDELGGE